jgi:hypothetical protein
MSLSRLLPHGMEVKQLVDAAIDRCERIGNLRADIKRCKDIAGARGVAAAARARGPSFAPACLLPCRLAGWRQRSQA